MHSMRADAATGSTCAGLVGAVASKTAPAWCNANEYHQPLWRSFMRRRFFTLDVFSSRRFAGNPLAVVLDADGLDEASMQIIAGEFNLAETVFVLPARNSGHRARLRIFTPAAELQFAGHPTVGTAVLLNWIDGGAVHKFVLEEGVGPISCTIELFDTGRGRARFELSRLPEEVGEAAGAAAIAGALGLRSDDIGFDAFRPSQWSAGMPMTFVPVRSLEAIRNCRTNLSEWDAAFEGNEGIAYVFCRETVETGSAFHARMFAPRLGIREDPATGAAAAAFAGVYWRFARPSDGCRELIIEQGYEMGRPSLIRLSITVTARELAGAAISGDAIIVSEGMIEA
jgi:trans-2,3-dihydro-3-hydroxyanthranilate isomerase